MRIVVAPDKLKASLSAENAAKALAHGAGRAGHDVDVCPLADGGEGTLGLWLAETGAEIRRTRVTGPTGTSIEASWGLADDGTALIESAQAIGLGRISSDPLPLEATSFGVGELVRHALDAGAKRIIVGLGGSATSDAGIGMAQALGVRFDGAGEPARALDLERVTRIDVSGTDPRLAQTEIVAACDVLSPLTGPRGAALLFAPQKGASQADAERIERAMTRFASLLGKSSDTPGSGAAGGLGFALGAFAGARLVSGADLVLDQLRFDQRIRAASLVITAEGRLDQQTLEGKLVAKVAERARRLGVMAVVIAGSVELEPEQVRSLGLTAAFSLCSGPMSVERAQKDAERLLADAAEHVVALIVR